MEDSCDISYKDDSNINSFCQATVDLQIALKHSIENILNRVSDNLFTDIYKNCYQGFEKKDDIQRPSLSGSSTEARNYRKQFNTFVIKSISEAVDETLDTMDSKLKELDELKKEQTDTSLKWRPPGNAFKHIIPFDTVSKMEEKKELENQVEKEKEVIDLLKTRLIQKRQKAKDLHNNLLLIFKEIEEAVKVPVIPDGHEMQENT